MTLIFSVTQYDLVAEAYLSGLDQLAKTTDDLSGVHSVASIFVSRMDTKVDQQLAILDTPLAQDLKGKIGIANAEIAYQHFKDKFEGQDWVQLARQGARVQRVLYGSTSTKKNPDYPDTLYVDNLIGAHTVNTVPPETLEAFLDHGTVAPTLEQDLDQARIRLEQLAGLSIDMSDISRQLLDEGVRKFADPYDQLIENIAAKKGALITG